MKIINQYGWYTAAYCKTTGLPMLNKQTYPEYENRYLSKTRCQKLGSPVTDDEQPVAFYRMANGYCALYDRSN